MQAFLEWLRSLFGPRPQPAAAPAAMSKGRVVALAGVLLVTIDAFQAAYTTGWEGMVFVPYRDVAGVLTVCVGHTGSDIVPGKVYTRDECVAMFANDLQRVVDEPLSQCLKPPLTLKPEVVAAVRDFAFNVGGGAACKSTLVKKLNAGDVPGACEEFQRWVYAGGRVIYGLQVRRMIGVPGRLSEADLCRVGI